MSRPACLLRGVTGGIGALGRRLNAGIVEQRGREIKMEGMKEEDNVEGRTATCWEEKDKDESR